MGVIDCDANSVIMTFVVLERSSHKVVAPNMNYHVPLSPSKEPASICFPKGSYFSEGQYIYIE